MIRLVTRGRFTHDYLKGLIDAPEDREAAVRKVIEAAGGKVINFYVTTGETDFLLISEANEAEGIVAALMACQHWKGLDRRGIQINYGKGFQSCGRVPTGQALMASHSAFEAGGKWRKRNGLAPLAC